MHITFNPLSIPAAPTLRARVTIRIPVAGLGEVILRDITIVDGPKGPFVSSPARRYRSARSQNDRFFNYMVFSRQFCATILRFYDQWLHDESATHTTPYSVAIEPEQR